MPDVDHILAGFLTHQCREGLALARQSDILKLDVVDEGGPPQRFVARFECVGLVARRQGGIQEATGFEVSIWFPEDYLRRADAREVLTILRPWDIWHPNVFGPAICVGRLVPGTGLVDLCYQLFEIFSFNKWSSHDGMNPAACQWARHNQARFPIDRRPLKRLRAAVATAGSGEGGKP